MTTQHRIEEAKHCWSLFVLDCQSPAEARAKTFNLLSEFAP